MSSSPASSATTIEPLTEPAGPEFFRYLDLHRAENGNDEVGYFMPQSREASRQPYDRAEAFQAGLGVPVGSPGWRRAWVAREVGGGIAGHVDLRAYPMRHAEHRCLLGLGVARGHRRTGLGARLMATAEEWARITPPLEWIDLEVVATNLPAIRLYHRCGFVTIGEMPEMFRIDGGTYAFTTMTKRLRVAGGGGAS